MNRDFMKYMRKYYAHIERACFMTLIASEDNMETDDPSGVAESDGAGEVASDGGAVSDGSGGAEPDGAGGASSGRGAGGAKSGRGAGGAKSVKNLQQRSLTSLFGKKDSAK